MRICSLPNTLIPLVCLAICFGPAAPEAGAGIEPDFLMDSDPQLQIPESVKDFDPAMAALWMQALQRPEIDLQRMAAETIARAHQRGIPDLRQAVPRLEEILLASSSHPAARFAAARALIVLDSRHSADKLLEAAQTHGADLSQLVEPALAQWGDTAATAVWLERLGSRRTQPRDLIRAIRGLAKLREQSALADLVSLTHDLTRTPGIRLEAATAAGLTVESGLEQAAARLAGNPRTPLSVSQLCAVRLLARHSTSAATQLLTGLAGDQESAVAAAALRRLNEIDSSLVLPLSDSAIRSPDPQVRRQGVICLLQLPTADHVESLSQLLADPHPDLRGDVCEGLYELSKDPQWNELIRSGAMQVLSGDRWQGQQQASLLLGALEHRPAAARLVELLESTRVEVRIPAAWALRKVAVPSSIPGVIDRARRETERRRGDATFEPGLDEHVAHLFEALGVMRAVDSTTLLMEYVPKDVRGNNRSRGAAIWALGRIYEGEPNEQLVEAFFDRIVDFQPRPREVSIVKEMSAVGLVRLQADELAPRLRELVMSDREPLTPRLHLALGWAVWKLTGEELPPPQAQRVTRERWFLEPLSQ